MNGVALFPGSFDPFTLGHKYVVDQGLELFDRIVIAIGINKEKQGLMTPENRMRLIRDLYRDEPAHRGSDLYGVDRSFLSRTGHQDDLAGFAQYGGFRVRAEHHAGQLLAVSGDQDRTVVHSGRLCGHIVECDSGTVGVRRRSHPVDARKY